MTGIDQTAARFTETLFVDKFKAFAPQDATDKTYVARTAKAVRTKFDEVATDLQKFHDTLRMIRASNPTGVTRD